MFLKKIVYIVIALFPLSSTLSAMSRDASSSSLDLVAVDANGNEIALGQLAGRPASPRGSAAATPLSQTDYEHVRVTPAPENAAAQPAVPLDLFAPASAPETPKNSLAISQITTEPPASPKSTNSKTTQAASVDSFAAAAAVAIIAPAPIYALNQAAPQHLPVEPLPAITPTATPRSKIPSSMASSACLPAPVLAAPPLTEPQRAALQIQLASLRNDSAPIPQAAQRPMQVAQHPHLARKNSGHTIDIAPESPAQTKKQDVEQDKSANCCTPFIICWKNLWSCSKPTH